MLAGHLAVALSAPKLDRRLPLALAVGAAFALDLLWPVLLLTGFESVAIHPGDTAFTNLEFESYPWSHSLLLALGWSLAGAAVGRAILGSWKRGALVGLLVLSHWVLDFVTHRPDLPLWPFGPRLGLGLWNSIPGTLLVEGTLLAVGVGVYARGTRARDRVGTWSFLGLVGLTTVIWVTQPWSPPPPSATAVAWGGIAFWLIVPWAAWIDRHRYPHGTH
jgi:hypothetical protein